MVFKPSPSELYNPEHELDTPSVQTGGLEEHVLGRKLRQDLEEISNLLGYIRNQSDDLSD
jgi:hypothetical protein